VLGLEHYNGTQPGKLELEFHDAALSMLRGRRGD
jgi:hypothetical protein